MKKHQERVDILGVEVDDLVVTELGEALAAMASGNSIARVGYLNAHVLRLAGEDERLLKALNRADVVFCDGYGIKVVSRVLGHRLRGRMTPPDWIDGFLEGLSKRGLCLFLLGDEREVVTRCAAMMKSNHPGLQVVGAHHGFFESEHHGESIARIIQDAGTDVVLVGMGSPKQEFWIDEQASHTGASLAIAVGALFRYYSGAEIRAPQFMTSHGLEWLARLLRHPIRHFDRYAIGLPVVMIRALRYRSDSRR